MKNFRIVKEHENQKQYYVLDGKFDADKNRAKIFTKTAAQKARNMLALTFSGQLVYIEGV